MSNSGIAIKNNKSKEIIILKLKDGLNTFGRGDNNDFILPETSEMASGTQFKIEKHSGEFFLINRSLHGTKIGKKVLKTAHRLEDGDCFEVFSYDYSFIFYKRIRLAKKTKINLSVAEKRKNEELNQKYFFLHEKIEKLLEEKNEVIKSDYPILLVGETGTGKTLLAKHIHSLSERRKKNFIKVSVPNVISTLFEDTLFGHVPGAFDGAKTHRDGAFKNADKGSIFLDEIGDINTEIQSKLLNVLQDKTFQQLGSDKDVKVDVRLIVASNQNLKEKLTDALYSRVAQVQHKIKIPPLRDMPEVIKPMSDFFIKKNIEKYGEDYKLTFSNDAIEMLEGYHWPYNIRELDSKIEYIMLIYKNKSVVTSKDLSKRDDLFEEDFSETKIDENISVKEYEKRKIINALKKCSGNIEKASKFTDIPKSTLYRKIKDYGIPKKLYII